MAENGGKNKGVNGWMKVKIKELMAENEGKNKGVNGWKCR